MITLLRSLCKKPFFLLLLPLVLLCGCSYGGVSQSPITSGAATQVASAAPGAATQVVSAATAAPTQASTLATAIAQNAGPAATVAAQAVFASYVGKWQAHGSYLWINQNYTGLQTFNVGPCSSAMCNGNAHIVWSVNADGSLKGTIQSVNYTEWSGSPAPSGYQADPSNPQAGDTFKLVHSGAHLLLMTWSGNRSGSGYWCDPKAVDPRCGA